MVANRSAAHRVIFLSFKASIAILRRRFLLGVVMPNLLVVDASSSFCSVALLNQGQSWAMAEEQPRRQAQRLLPMVDELLKKASVDKSQLQGIAYGRGPGSFTGIRIAASVMQGIALALDLPVYGVSSLQALAEQALQLNTEAQQVLVLMNAHMNEVFWAIYKRNLEGISQLQGTEKVGSSAECLADIAQFDGVLAGNGLQLEDFSHLEQRYAALEPQAEAMQALVLDAWQNQRFGDFEQHQPVYLRDSVAWKKLDEQPSLLKK